MRGNTRFTRNGNRLIVNTDFEVIIITVKGKGHIDFDYQTRDGFAVAYEVTPDITCNEPRLLQACFAGLQLAAVERELWLKPVTLN